MDYEKKYKDLVEAVKKLQGANPSDEGIQKWVEDNVPELKESEDEKIRKELINYLYDVHDDDEERAKWIPWLEKQGEQKSVEFKPSFRVGDMIRPKDPVLGEPRIIERIYSWGYDTNKGILDFEFEDNWELDEHKLVTHKYNVGATIYYNSFSGIKSMVVANVIDTGDGNPMYEDADGNDVFEKDLILQMHVERQIPIVDDKDAEKASEEYRNFRMSCGIKDPVMLNEIEEAYYEGAIRQKPVEWSEKDEEALRLCIRAIETVFYYKADLKLQATDWLKSIKDRIIPQPKQEWSEEDCNQIETIACHLDNIGNGAMAELLLNIMNKYKSLRPQNTWKPSDEHYELEEFAKIVRGNLTGISKAVQELFKAKYLQLTGNKMYGGYKD